MFVFVQFLHVFVADDVDVYGFVLPVGYPDIAFHPDMILLIRITNTVHLVPQPNHPTPIPPPLPVSPIQTYLILVPKNDNRRLCFIAICYFHTLILLVPIIAANRYSIDHAVMDLVDDVGWGMQFVDHFG